MIVGEREGTLLKEAEECSPPSVQASSSASPQMGAPHSQRHRPQELMNSMVLTGSQHRATGGSTPVLLWNGEAFGKADKDEDRACILELLRPAGSYTSFTASRADVPLR